MEHFDIFQNHFKTLIPELFFISSTFILLLYGVIYNPSAYYKFPILTKPIGWLAIQTLFITVLLLTNHQTEASSVILNNVLINDDFTLVIKTIILLSALSSILISLDYMGTKNQKINSFELILLILFSTLGMLFIVSSYDLITMYLAIELQSLSFYVIAAFQRNNEFSTEAGLKYFILGALSSGILLFGESILYGFTGITNFEELCKLFTASKSPVNETFITDASYQLYPEWIDKIAPSSAAVLGLFFILIAFLFKIGSVPFHMWTPDVYEGAPTSVTAFFAITPKIAIIALMLRLTIYTFYDLIEAWQIIIVICAFLSMFVGTFGAINQNKIKRLFAYSSIAHVGYLLIALSTGTIESIESLLVYIIIYILMIINVFGILLVMAKEDFHVQQNLGVPNLANGNGKERLGYNKKNHWYLLNSSFQEKENSGVSCSFYKKQSLPAWDIYSSNPKGSEVTVFSEVKSWSAQSLALINNRNGLASKKKDQYIKYVSDLSTLSKTNPLLAATAATIFFSNAGVPPLSGFYGKLNVFLAAMENSMYFLAFSGVICSVIGAFYSIRLIKILYFHSVKEKHWNHYKPISKENSIVLGITFFFTLFFFLSPSFLFTITHSAALSLCL